MLQITIIIPTYNALNYLKKLLDKISTQSLDDYELIIIDSCSKDKTVEIAKKYTDNVVIIPQNEFDHGGTRAKAARIAKGSILVYLTQDALPYDDYTIENLVDIFKDKNVAAVYGQQISYENTSLFGKHLREFNYPNETLIRTKNGIKKYGIKTAQLSNSFAAYRKDILLKVGNFKDGLILGEDVYIGAKMILEGYSLVYTDKAKVYHSHSYSVLEEFRRYFDIGVFHQQEYWILDQFGKVEGEGMRYIKSELKYLLDNGGWYLVPEFFVRNTMKYCGYKLGQRYKNIPKFLIPKLSMHHKWWNNKLDNLTYE